MGQISRFLGPACALLLVIIAVVWPFAVLAGFVDDLPLARAIEVELAVMLGAFGFTLYVNAMASRDVVLINEASRQLGTVGCRPMSADLMKSLYGWSVLALLRDRYSVLW